MKTKNKELKDKETLLRQWHMLQVIPRHPFKISTNQLLDKLNGQGYYIDIRSVQRDLKSLSFIFPLVSDEKGKPYGWNWAKGAPLLSLPGLSNIEAITFNLVEQHLKAMLPVSIVDQLQPFFRTASEKLENLPEPTNTWLNKVRVIPPTQKLLPPTIDPNVHLRISEALLLDKKISVTYQDSEKDRLEKQIVHPYALVVRQPSVYLICRFDNESEPSKPLPLHRFKSAEILDEPVQRPSNFNLDAYIASDKGLGFGGSGKLIRLEANFTKVSGKHLYETHLSEDQIISTIDKDRLKVVATVAYTEQLRWWLQNFGDQVEVIAPPELREVMRKTANALYEKYNKN
jgi:predicted DNA-binding transcriptional regulator YafY